MTEKTPGKAPDLDSLAAMGAFVNEPPVIKSISFDIDGKRYNAKIGVVELAIREAELLARHTNIGRRDLHRAPDEPDDTTTAAYVAACARFGPDLTETMTYAKAQTMHPHFARACYDAIQDVLNPQKKSSTAPSD